MAHRLLTNVFWAGIEYGPGLPAGDQIPGLSLSDEAGLVSSNRAVYTSPPPVINNGLPVLWVPNPDGGIGIVIGSEEIGTVDVGGTGNNISVEV